MILRGLEKRYGAHPAVHAINLDIAAGEFLSIVGPSGSGKTTLLTMIAGFEPPSAGSIVLGERDITAVPPNRRQIGMVFQKYALFPHMSVRKNIEFPLRMRGRSMTAEGRRRVDAMLDLVHLGTLQQRLPHQLSGGQQQRVAVARALVFDPPVILMDEPLGALDKKLRETMQLEIKRLQRRLGATVIYVTHDQEEALTMSDRVAVMQNGRLEQIGSPSELYTDPANPFVADFVGSTNFLAGVEEDRNSNVIRVRLSDGMVADVPLARDRSRRPAEEKRLRLAVRPEHLAIVREDEPVGGSLRGNVENLVFAGAATTAHVRLSNDGRPLRVAIPADLLPTCQPGTELRLALCEEKVSLFGAEKAVAA